MNDNELYGYEQALLVDEVSSTEIYIGNSKNGKTVTSSNWKIKKIWKVDTVWHFGFPDGDQKFNKIWNDRYNYDYI